MGIRFREDRNKYEVVYYVNGKRKRKHFDSKEDAEAFANPSTRPTSTLVTAIRNYTEIHTSRKSKRNDEKHYFEVLYNFLWDDCEVQHLADVTLTHLQKLQNHLHEKKGLAKSSVNRYFNTYKHFFNSCVDWKLITESPAARMKSLPEDKKTIKRHVWSDEEIETALRLTKGWLHEFIKLVAFTGMRPIEVTRLTWRDHVDLTEGVVKAICYKGKGEPMERWLPVNDDVLGMLKARKLKAGRSSHVFVSNLGNPLSTQVVDHALARKLKDTSLEGYTMYGMRHSFATMNLENGMDLDTIRELMGHTNLTTTQVYLHQRKDRLKKAMLEAQKKRQFVGATTTATSLPPRKLQTV